MTTASAHRAPPVEIIGSAYPAGHRAKRVCLRPGRGMQRRMYTVAQLIGGVWGAGGAGGELVVHDPADGAPVSAVPVATADEVGQGGGGGPGGGGRVGGDRPGGAGGGAAPGGGRGRGGDRRAGRGGDRGDGQAARGRPGRRRRRASAPCDSTRSWARCAAAGRCTARPTRWTSWRPQPRGVVAAITPWNDPVAVSCGLLGAALVTGNVVLYKPSERTPATGWLLARALDGALPAGVLSLLTGGRRGGRGAGRAGRGRGGARRFHGDRPGDRRGARPAPARRCCWRTAAATR